jgi:hypothetical protein
LLVIPGVGAVAISVISYSGADVDRKRAEIEIYGLKTLLEKSTEISTNFFFSDMFYTLPSVH